MSERSERVSKMNVAELKDELRVRGLPVGGNKPVLVARLTAALEGDKEGDGDAVVKVLSGLKRTKEGGEGSKSKKKSSEPVEPLPAEPSPWLSRCIQRWGLVAPYDPKVAESQWEAYFKERATLEWLTNAVMAGWMDCRQDPRQQQGPPKLEGDKEEDSKGKKKKNKGAKKEQGEAAVAPESLKWTEDFEPPLQHLKNFCHEFYEEYYSWGDEEYEVVRGMTQQLRAEVEACLNGCTGLKDKASLSRLLASGMFLLKFWVNFEDPDDPRTIDMTTRLYSPNATGRSIDLKYDFHHRDRSSFSESFSSCAVRMRSASDTQPLQPQAFSKADNIKLFTSDTQDSGWHKRSFITKTGLQDLGAWLLGGYNLISERKAMTLAVRACGLTLFGTDEHTSYALRVTRRKHRLLSGETSDARSDGDYDSDNVKPKSTGRGNGRGGDCAMQ